jgi:DNA-binding GntR family transcriptional regulator
MATVTPLRVAARPPRTYPALKPARVAELIRGMIIEDRLPPGTPIRERALAEQLQVSRTPLREALKILTAEGLVLHTPRRGVVVADPSDEEVRELLQLLGVIEAYAGELACASATEEEIREIKALHLEMLAAYTRGDRLGCFRRNQDIHVALVRATGNGTLMAHHRTLNARVYRIRYVCNLRTERWQSAIEDHEAILEALERRDAVAIAGLLKTHLLQAFEKMLDIMAAERAPARAVPEAS